MEASVQDPKFRSGALWGASVTAVAIGFLAKDRNWALIGLGALGFYMAQGGELSADKLPKSLPKLPDDIPGVSKLRSLFPEGSAAIQDATNGNAWSLNL